MGSHGVCPTLIDYIPDHVVTNVLRFWSDRPRHSDWAAYIGLEQLSLLSQEQHVLHRAAVESITELQLSSKKDQDDPELAQSLCDIFVAFGESCSTLRVRLPRTDFDIWVPEFEIHCRGVRCLDLWALEDEFPIDAVLAAQQGLEELILRTGNQAATWESIARHGRGLKKLHADIGRMNPPALREALEVVGSTLKSLAFNEISLSPNTEETFEQLSMTGVGRLCPHVSSLELFGDFEFVRRDVEEMCIVYGEQLEKLVFSYCGKNRQFLYDLITYCPYVNVTTDLIQTGQNMEDFLHGPKPDPTKTMDILGPNLVSFSMRFGFPVTPDFSAAVSKCSNLSELEVTDGTHPGFRTMLQAIFASKKLYLDSLRIIFKKPVDEAPASGYSDILDMITTHTSILRIFFLCFPVVEPWVLKRLADANEKLEFVNIRVHFRDGAPESAQHYRQEYFVHVIKAFSGCARLRSICIDDEKPHPGEKLPEVENFCTRIRNRGVCVSVRGVWYLL